MENKINKIITTLAIILVSSSFISGAQLKVNDGFKIVESSCSKMVLAECVSKDVMYPITDIKIQQGINIEFNIDNPDKDLIQIIWTNFNEIERLGNLKNSFQDKRYSSYYEDTNTVRPKQYSSFKYKQNDKIGYGIANQVGTFTLVPYHTTELSDITISETSISMKISKHQTTMNSNMDFKFSIKEKESNQVIEEFITKKDIQINNLKKGTKYEYTILDIESNKEIFTGLIKTKGIYVKPIPKPTPEEIIEELETKFEFNPKTNVYEYKVYNKGKLVLEDEFKIEESLWEKIKFWK
jgi:hypothetical protein